MGNLRIQRKKRLLKSEGVSAISIEISVVRQGGFEPSTFGSGGQRRPLYESLFLQYLKLFLFFPGAISVRKRFQNLPYICTKRGVCATTSCNYSIGIPSLWNPATH